MSKPTIIRNIFSIENTILKVLGVFSTEKSPAWYKIYGYIILLFFVTLFPLLVIKDLITLEFNNALPSWFCFIAYFTIIPITLTYFFHQKTINDILQRLEQEPFLPRVKKVDDAVKLILLKWYRLKNVKAFLFLMAIFTSVVSQTIYSFVLRLTKSDPNDWKMGYGELLNITYSPNFEIVFIYETISVFYSTIIASTIIVIIVGVLDYITTQYKILQYNLKTLLIRVKRSLPLDLNESEIKWNIFQKEIKNCVVYHISITNILKEFEDVFSNGIFFIFISIQSMICIDIYRASLFSLQDLRSYRIFVEIMSVSIGLFLINLAGENMTFQREQISNAVYELDIVGTDIRLQKSLVIIMRQSQRPVRMKAGKFIDISLVSFAKILKASYSIYAMLKTTNENVA